MLVVDKLVRMEVVDAVAVFNWLFSEQVTPHFTQQYVWDILEGTVLKTNRSHDRSIKQLAEANEQLKKVEVCLFVKHMWICAYKLLENGLGTRGRTSYLLIASGVGSQSPTWTTAVE